MQFQITFRVVQPGQLLPLSYQYELSAWIYGLISSTNSAFGEFLHTRGYASKNKRFKFFTFSNLNVPPRFEIQGDRMKINSSKISFVVSFLVEQAAQDMILGLFQQQTLKLGDRISQVELAVVQVQALPPSPISSSRVSLRATSPILVSEPELREDGKLHHHYLHPADEKYQYYFFKNLLDKYQAALQYELINPIAMDLDLTFRLLTEEPKKRGIRIKAFTHAETKIIGYLYDFEIKAPVELIRFGMLAGFGGENALGFGATRFLGNGDE